MNLAKMYDHEFPQRYFKEFIEYIGVTEEEFHATVDKYRSPHLWGKDDAGEWKLRHNVWQGGLDD